MKRVPPRRERRRVSVAEERRRALLHLVELAEESAAVASLVEGLAQDSREIDVRIVAAAARALRRTGQAAIEHLAQLLDEEPGATAP